MYIRYILKLPKINTMKNLLKNTIALILTLIILSSCSEQKTSYHYFFSQKLNGKVKTIKQSIFSVEERFGEIVIKKPRSSGIPEYSDFYMVDSKQWFDLTFDQNNNLLKEKLFYSSYDFKSPSETIIYKNNIGTIYDENGLETRDKIHINTRPDSIIYETNWTDKNNKITYRDHFIYNKEVLTEYLEFGVKDGKEEKISKRLFVYKKNLLIQEIFYDSEGLEKLNIKHEYNDNLIRKNSLISVPNKSIKRIQYDYTFDIKKNWITEVTKINDKPIYIVKREIEYYN